MAQEILLGGSAHFPGTFSKTQGSSEDQRRELPYAVPRRRHAALHHLQETGPRPHQDQPAPAG